MNKYETEQEFLDNQRLLYAGKINKILTQVLCTQFPDETDAMHFYCKLFLTKWRLHISYC